ncbi:hypothetical protein FRB94_008926 [Tulasnella sp. JGI-2019a]|nr:hypothetical protein FRB93_008196 [Tulasnella sp. JGI-2019a]KAG8995560.1 hypothetical protein FRB94_008926 [Tulasnella sp. JGI-2019a]
MDRLDQPSEVCVKSPAEVGLEAHTASANSPSIRLSSHHTRIEAPFSDSSYPIMWIVSMAILALIAPTLAAPILDTSDPSL